MKYSSKCNVSVYPQHKRCPLCDEPLGKADISSTAYPQTFSDKTMHFWRKAFLFFCITASVICIFINFFQPQNSQFLWSMIVCASCVSLWIITSSIVSKTISPGAKLLNIYFAAIIVAFVIDFVTGYYKWSTTFLIPFATIGLTALLTLLAIRERKHYHEYRGYLIAMFFISLCPIVIFLLSLSDIAWTAFAAVVYSLLTAVGFWIFSRWSIRKEVKKRLHM